METQLLSELYEKYSREIHRYLLGLCGNNADAEELTQETFLKALLSLNSSHANVRAWLYTVARNLFYDKTRRADAERRALEELPSGEQPGPETELEKKLVNRQLAKAMMKLEARKREVISLQYFSGLTVKEIAAVMKLSQENVRVLAFRAKKELKRIMEEDENEVQ